jgi:hypothetical protein
VIHDLKIELDIIPKVDLYKCEPQELASMVCNKYFLHSFFIVRVDFLDYV